MNFKLKVVNLKEGENILAVLHKHWFVLVKPLLRLFLIFFLPLLLTLWLFGLEFIISSVFTSLLFLVWLVVGGTAVIYEWFVWYYDIYIITNKRIVDITQKSLFSREISEASLGKIQDITFEISGFFATLFNYGDVKVQTAGATEVIKLEAVEDPAKVVEKLNEACEVFQKEEGGPLTAQELIEALEIKKKEEHQKAQEEEAKKTQLVKESQPRAKRSKND